MEQHSRGRTVYDDWQNANREMPFPQSASVRLSLARTPHGNPGYPLYANSPILLPRRWHRIYVRRQREPIWYWANVPDVTVLDLIDTMSEDPNNTRLALVYSGGEIMLEDEMTKVPLSWLRGRLMIAEEGDLRFSLYQYRHGEGYVYNECSEDDVQK